MIENITSKIIRYYDINYKIWLLKIMEFYEFYNIKCNIKCNFFNIKYNFLQKSWDLYYIYIIDLFIINLTVNSIITQKIAFWPWIYFVINGDNILTYFYFGPVKL